MGIADDKTITLTQYLNLGHETMCWFIGVSSLQCLIWRDKAIDFKTMFSTKLHELWLGHFHWHPYVDFA